LSLSDRMAWPGRMLNCAGFAGGCLVSVSRGQLVKIYALLSRVSASQIFSLPANITLEGKKEKI
ncbi:MAG: hypothetical protein AAGC99_10845, partial [Pseudomonadota bacterium]